jgi:hypothetical protein
MRAWCVVLQMARSRRASPFHHSSQHYFRYVGEKPIRALFQSSEFGRYCATHKSRSFTCTLRAGVYELLNTSLAAAAAASQTRFMRRVGTYSHEAVFTCAAGKRKESAALLVWPFSLTRFVSGLCS